MRHRVVEFRVQCTNSHQSYTTRIVNTAIRPPCARWYPPRYFIDKTRENSGNDLAGCRKLYGGTHLVSPDVTYANIQILHIDTDNAHVRVRCHTRTRVKRKKPTCKFTPRGLRMDSFQESRSTTADALMTPMT